MKTSLIQSDALSVGSRYAKRKESGTTQQDVAKPHSFSMSCCTQNVTTSGFIMTRNGPLQVVSYGPGGTRKFYPWQTP